MAKKSTLASSGVPTAIEFRREHAGEENRELRVLAAAKLEIQVVDAEDCAETQYDRSSRLMQRWHGSSADR